MLNWEESYRLSRFVVLHPDEEGLVLDSPLTTRRFAVRGPSVVRLLMALCRPIQLNSFILAVEEPQRESVRALLEALDSTSFLTRVYRDGTTDEETSGLVHWEFHDLLFHARSRLGRNAHPVGGTYRLRNRLPPEPALRAHLPSESISLPLPAIETPRDGSLLDTLERRRSSYGLGPLDISSLSTFLYRSCRITHLLDGGSDALIRKVYPSGGSLHPLSVYLAISGCPGCAPGLYRYLDLEHALTLVRTLDSSVQRLILDARNSVGGLPGMPPVLLIVSARFGRTAWKYESIAYRLILLETGALFQTMYLVATGMGLTACALGCGDSDHFARTIGSNYYHETSVGELLLGAPVAASL